MKKIITPILSCWLILFVTVVFSQVDVIGAKDAGKLIGKENTVFVSLRTAADYQKVHISGAVNINHLELNGQMSILKSPSEIAVILGQNGIQNTSDILLYDDGTGRYSGRMYWILNYMGAQNIRIIDGGMKGWRLARQPVTKNPTNIDPVTFTPKINKSIIATMAEVKTAIKDPAFILVDVRSPVEYDGSAPNSTTRPGHIPKAINLEFTNVMDAQGMMKSTSELTDLFIKTKITKDKTVILYCQTSVRAGIVFMALKGLGYPAVKVYDGAYLEWQSVSGNQVVMN